MHFLCTLDLERLCVESSTAKIEVRLPEDFFSRSATEGYHPIMSHDQVNNSVHEFLHEELAKLGWLQRLVFRFRGSVVRLLIDEPVARILSGWELDNLMEFLLHARVLHIGLSSDNPGRGEWSSRGQVFLKWPDRVAWKKTIAESSPLRYGR